MVEGSLTEWTGWLSWLTDRLKRKTKGVNQDWIKLLTSASDRGNRLIGWLNWQMSLEARLNRLFEWIEKLNWLTWMDWETEPVNWLTDESWTTIEPVWI